MKLPARPLAGAQGHAAPARGARRRRAERPAMSAAASATPCSASPVSDVDLATRLPPEEVMERLDKARIKAVPTGLAHGTVTAVIGGAPVEVTTLAARRLDRRPARDHRLYRRLEGGCRRGATSRSTPCPPIRRAARSTIISAASPISRPDASASSAIRSTRIAEDHLRILRFFRFHARFGAGEADRGRARRLRGARQRSDGACRASGSPTSCSSCSALAEPVAALRLMVERDILKPVLPEIGAAGVERLARLVGREARGRSRAPTRSAASPPCCRPIPRSPRRSRPACACRSGRRSGCPPRPLAADSGEPGPGCSPIGSAWTKRSTASCSATAIRRASKRSPAGSGPGCWSAAAI